MNDADTSKNKDAMNNIFNEYCQDDQCFLDRLVALISNCKEFSITFTNFAHALLAHPD